MYQEVEDFLIFSSIKIIIIKFMFLFFSTCTPERYDRLNTQTCILDLVFFIVSFSTSNISLTEFTTMAGRRLRNAVKAVLTSSGNGQFGSNIHVVIAGLTNTYSQYVTTFEEYQVQRYEVST